MDQSRRIILERKAVKCCIYDVHLKASFLNSFQKANYNISFNNLIIYVYVFIIKKLYYLVQISDVT